MPHFRRPLDPRMLRDAWPLTPIEPRVPTADEVLLRVWDAPHAMRWAAMRFAGASSMGAAMRGVAYTVAMPVHDWTRVDAGVVHHFHNAWLIHLATSLNRGGLPRDYYALAKQRSGGYGPDVLALERRADPDVRGSSSSSSWPGAGRDVRGSVAVEEAPPRTSITLTTDVDADYADKQLMLTIRHVSGHRVVAVIEVASRGNKGRRTSVEKFVEKAVAMTRSGYHLVIIDLFPPRRHDPNGLCAAAFDGMGGDGLALPPGKPLCVAAFRAARDGSVHCYADAVGVGDPLPDASLFLDADHYVNAPLAGTYDTAFVAMPDFIREQLAAV